MVPVGGARQWCPSVVPGGRLQVPDDNVPWSRAFTSYEPPSWTSDKVKRVVRTNPNPKMRWADPEELDEETRAEVRQRITYPWSAQEAERPQGRRLGDEASGVTFAEDDGLPLNPRGRTGLRGRGTLGRCIKYKVQSTDRAARPRHSGQVYKV